MYINNDDQSPARVIGSFAKSKNEDFKNGINSLMEGFKTQYGLDPLNNMRDILENDVLCEQYKEALIGDILNDDYNDPYLNLMPAKIEQLFENSRQEIIEENYAIPQLSPIVGYTLPILKKNYIECHAKDIVMTEVPSKPVIKLAFERKFLKDKAGNKYYVPEIFYDESYKEVSEKAKGKKVSDKWYPEEGALPMQDLAIMNESGGFLETRDTLAHDFCIQALKLNVDGEEVIKQGLDIKPDYSSHNNMTYRVKHVKEDGTVLEEVLTGTVDYYHGLVTIATSGAMIQQVQFGGHLSNQNNNETIEMDKERETVTWHIGEGERINCALTIEKIKDMKAMMGIDVTPEAISDMSSALTQFEDAHIMSYLKDSLEIWRDKTDLPFGYTGGFVETASFSCVPAQTLAIPQSQYIESELKFRFNRLLSELKDKLKTTDLMFVAYGHPTNIELFNAQVDWKFDEGSKVGGIVLDYKFGVITESGTRIHVVSSLKVPKEAGIRVVAYPTTDEQITFKHFKYSFNIENMYRNPLTPLVPNIMGTHRYRTESLLPVQGQLLLKDNDFGIDPRN